MDALLRDLAKLLTYLMAVVLLGALLAPPLFWAGRTLVEQGVLPALSPFAFEKYLNRAVQAVALLGLWPFLRWAQVRRWSDLRMARNPRGLRDLAAGFLVALVGLATLVVVLVHSGYLRYTGHGSPTQILLALATATAVASVEEIFFRGALQGILRRRLSRGSGGIVLAGVFAAVHFIRSDPALPRVHHADWHTGLSVVPHLFWQFSHPQLMLGLFATLFVFGLVLSEAKERTRSLWMSVGLHGGWVFAWLVAHANTVIVQPNVWVANDLRSGLAPLLLVAGTGALLATLPRSSAPSKHVVAVTHLRGTCSEID